MTKNGMIWVDSETARKISSGEIDLKARPDPQAFQASLNYALSQMHWDKGGDFCSNGSSSSKENDEKQIKLEESVPLQAKKSEASISDTIPSSIMNELVGMDRIDKLAFLSDALDNGTISFEEYSALISSVDEV